MKIVISILLLLVMSIRSVLPLIDYAVNYDYISTQLCENKAKPELLCNGKCFVKKELTKSSENQNCKENKVQILKADVFLAQDFLSFSVNYVQEKTENVFHENCNFHHQQFFRKFFHPPLV